MKLHTGVSLLHHVEKPDEVLRKDLQLVREFRKRQLQLLRRDL